MAPTVSAIQRFIEDPLADFVLAKELPAGSTVVVGPAPEGEEGEVRLTIVKPKKAKTPIAVGAGGAAAEDDAAVSDDGAPAHAGLDEGVGDVEEPSED